MKLKRYRIVKDRYSGYQVDVWRLWWPFWMQLDGCNTHPSIERAKRHIQSDKNRVVEYVDV